ncbi:caspase domain-containing protein [Armillaria novae-zelandiae]|uniref:Caspase domain-containing protein n=1 Tax=Armillaria novae-zelandiae TaxID=153914 RepID=A0AA39PAN0_9AGAR|nr:caspase domain-containing protein [Armillaria novae-zelandiae]
MPNNRRARKSNGAGKIKSSTTSSSKGKGTRGKEATKGTSNIFALIIGIDKYERDEYQLGGAVADANEFEHYVRTDLGAPKENIISLRDEKATRSRIIGAFRTLEHRKDIVQGTAIIIIYYAGHGAVAKKPTEWEDWHALDNNIEMLCPVDITFQNSVKEKKVEGIPDRTISRLLLDLSAAKGNNIVLILDCCHSAGIDRGVGVGPGDDAKAREIDDEKITISAGCDSSIYSGRPSGSRKSSQSTNITNFGGSLWGSHILLAACGRNQKAWEKQKKGLFTRALLQAVRETGAYLTYRSLMLRFNKMPSYQSPQLDGNNIHQRLFYPSQESVDTSMILCHREDKQPYLIIEAGHTLGITKGSTYQLYRTDLPESESLPLGTAVVKEVETECTSQLLPDDSEFFVTHGDISNFWYARLVKASRQSLLIYCDDSHSSFLEKVIKENPTQLTVPVARTNNRQEADLCLAVEGDDVIFDRGEGNSYFNDDNVSFELMKDNNLFRSMESPRIDVHSTVASGIVQTQQIINRYANFTYHLTVRSPQSVRATFDVTVTMHKLERMEGKKTLRPINGSGGSFRCDNEKLVRIDVDMSIDIPKRPLYGFTLKNDGSYDLYACLFYFDASTLDIENWTHSRPNLTDDTERQTVDPCIPAGDMLTFGFGNTATRPIAFDIPEGQDVDICCFKIYLSLKPLDLRSISQTLKTFRGAKQVEFEAEDPPVPDKSWASLVIPVIQQRLKKSHK